jgi:hypothetical protein
LFVKSDANQAFANAESGSTAARMPGTIHLTSAGLLQKPASPITGGLAAADV